MNTCESRVSENLYRHVAASKSSRVLSWNPPNAKSYRAPNLKLPWREGSRRRRDLVDAIWVSTDSLVLAELKCYTSESEGDIEKLRRIRHQLGLQDLVTLLRRQGADLAPEPRQLALVLGVEKLDTDVPADFTAMEVAEEAIVPFFGSEVGDDIRNAIKGLCMLT